MATDARAPTVPSRTLTVMMGTYFVVLSALGILRPVRNALALDGIGGTNFYRVYVVSALVVFVAPLLDRLARRLTWRQLIPGVALAFVGALVLFRSVYAEGSAALGYAFYGFYDVASAALVTLFFIAAQFAFDARQARTAYPMIIASGSLGATAGGAVTGFFTDNLGVENLLLVAAGLVALVAVGLPLTLPAPDGRGEPEGLRRTEQPKQHGLLELLRDRHVVLIATSVLLMVLVKQWVDYQYNAFTKEAFETLEAVSSFQGKFDAATQWLPFAVLVGLRPAMKRWGVGLALFLLPSLMLAANAVLAVWWTLWTAVGAQALERTFRHSAERAAREVLYVPLAEDVKPRAKAYIDATLADGIGKVASVALIGIALAVLEPRQAAFVTMALCLLWLGVTVALKREYVGALARSIRGRYASFRGLYASLSDASSGAALEGALASGDTLQASFALDIVEGGSSTEISRFAPELHALIGHEAADIRVRSLRALGKSPDAVDTKRVETALGDPEPAVREAAVTVLCASDVQGPAAAVENLLASPHRDIRIATLTCMGRGDIPGLPETAGKAYVESLWDGTGGGPAEERLEIALAAATLGEDPLADEVLARLLHDPDPDVASAALKSAGQLRRHRFYPRMIQALGHTATRRAAMEALWGQGEQIVPLLSYHLLDPQADPQVRLAIPQILSRMPHQATVDALLESFLAPETGQIFDFRSLKALSRLRQNHPELEFDGDTVAASLDREVEAARGYERALTALAQLDPEHRGVRLLNRALHEAWAQRREGVFRLLGLLQDQERVYRCFRALTSGSEAGRATALEWLEATVGRARFESLGPVLAPEPALDPAPVPPADAFLALWTDNDASLSHAALWTAADLKFPWFAEKVEELERTEAWNQVYGVLARTRGDYALDLLGREDSPGPGSYGDGRPVDPLEKIFLLQNVDVLREARSAHFALLASIAEEVEAKPGTVLMTRGEPPEALYVVVDGAVTLEADDGQVIDAEAGRPFGTWALIDRAASLVTARVKEPSRLIRVTRTDFHDLLADYPELATELLQGLARKVRALVQ